MPPKNCGACNKLVYPMDELKCLDKTWHKACFRCQTCNMTLNMKNYKGYNKLPYCNAHYPTTKFTAVADTPENKRIAQNTRLQSNVKYHADFEAAKGQYTAVADDPETLRVRKNMSTISNVAYHGDMMRKMEMENARPSDVETPAPPVPVAAARKEPVVSAGVPARQPGSISDYDPMGNSNDYSSKPKAVDPQPDVTPTEPPVAAQPAPSFPPPVAAQRAPSPPPPEPEVPEPEVPEPEVPEPEVPEPEPSTAAPDASDKGNISKALYDYTAADDDEVTFNEDDLIINCEAIDEGWMNGRVEKTGQCGMLPSNYVERLNW